MIEPFDLNQFEETRYLEPSPCADEIARLRQLVEGLRNEIELDWSPQVDKLSLQVIQLEAQAALVAAERDELRAEIASDREWRDMWISERDAAQADARELARYLVRVTYIGLDGKRYMVNTTRNDELAQAIDKVLTEHGAKYLPQKDGRAYIY